MFPCQAARAGMDLAHSGSGRATPGRRRDRPRLARRGERPAASELEMRNGLKEDVVHTEHLQNVRPLPALWGWVVAIGVTSLLIFILLATGLLGEERDEGLWVSVALLIGFWAGGFFTGFRVMQAPILHGVTLGMISIIAWFLLNLLASLFFPTFRWEMLTPQLTAGLLVVHIVASVVGALMGYNMALRGRPSLEEHPPEVEPQR